jgi:hypothetical protein
LGTVNAKKETEEKPVRIEKVRRERDREERVSRKKIKERDKAETSRNTVFFRNRLRRVEK